MTTSQQSRLGSAPEEGVKAPVVTISSGQETLFDVGQTIGGVVVADQDRVAINAQTDPLENGIYVARAGKVWERSTDMNGPDDVQTGQLMSDENTSAVYTISVPAAGWTPGLNSVSFGLLLSPVGFFWGAITGTLSNQADLQAELDAKAAVVHTHVEADITDLQAYLTDAAGSIAMDGEFYVRQDTAWVAIDFSVFAPAVHTHVEADITDLQAYLTDAPSNDELYARANGAWVGFSTASGTTGEIIGWPHDEVPQNFLECDGQSINAVTFADLFAVLGYKYGGSGANFNLPDLRGEHLRGWDHGRGADPDAASRTDRGDGGTGDLVGTKQGAAVGPHAHTFSAQQNIGGFTDNGGAPDQRSTQQNANTGTTGSGIGGDTRGRNVQLMYIIRYTGGGSGITQPPSIEVQDSGVPLTTAVQLLNFEGFTLTEPLDDQITIQFGASPNSALYCPGYTYVFIDTTTWRIDGFDVTNLFNVGRRLQFTDGAALYYGTIIASVFGGGNTTMTMSMEDSEILTNTITEVCLTTNAADWSPIAGDPFGGTAIHDICSGVVDGTVWWVACGAGGKLAYSNDAGVTWTAVVTGTSESLRAVAYSPFYETFMAVGDVAVNIRTLSGDTPADGWTLDTTVLAAEGAGGQLHCYGVVFDHVTDRWGVYWQDQSTNYRIAYDLQDNGATWTNAGAAWGATESPSEFHALDVRERLTPNTIVMILGDNVEEISDLIDTTEATIFSGTGTQLQGMIITVINALERGFTGNDDGQLREFNGGFIDDVTFGASQVMDFARSNTLERTICVGADGKIGYFEDANLGQIDAWDLAPNGANPLSRINCVHRNDTDGFYICANDMGQILRSSSGVGAVIAPPALSGWTPIAADPFSGGNIQHIATGVIGGVQYWVIAGSTLIFTSTDAGVTWTSRTSGVSGSITDLKYDSTNEAFVAACANGDFTRTVNGTTWTADTTTVQALPGMTGSGSINSLVWSPSAGTWWVCIEYTLASAQLYSVSADMLTWTAGDTSVTSGSCLPNAHIYDPTIAARTLYTGIGISYFHYLDPTDSAGTAINNMDALITAALGKPGTLGSPQDMFIGNVDGKIELMSSTTVRTVNDPALNGPVNAFAYTSTNDRMIAVGNAGEIKTQDGPAIEGPWIDVGNPMTANINDVDYNATDDMFICVCADGVIARSVDGISEISMPATETFEITEGSSGLNFDGFSDGTGLDATDQPAAGSIDIGTLYDGSTIHQCGTDVTLGAIFYFFVEGDWTNLIDTFEVVGDTTFAAGAGVYDAGEDRTRFNAGFLTVAAWDGAGTSTVIVTYV